MDDERFDGLTRALGAGATRRGALGLLTGLVGLGTGEVGARDRRKAKAKQDRKGKTRKKPRTPAPVSTEAADCLSPGPSSNMSGCDFAGEDFSGDDLSGSSMVGTVFRTAELVRTNLSSSNLRGADFRGADLTCADLSSSVLRNADFRGFAAGRPTTLFGADLSSSGGCGSIRTNARTLFCGTTLCDGSVRNDDCPPGTDPTEVCCGGCGDCQRCVDGRCEDEDNGAECMTTGGAAGSCCAGACCASSCDCVSSLNGTFCYSGRPARNFCTSDADCPVAGTSCEPQDFGPDRCVEIGCRNNPAACPAGSQCTANVDCRELCTVA